MALKSGRAFLHTPGPTHIPDAVMVATQRQSYDLADPEFETLFQSLVADLKPVFGTLGEVFLYAANGHGAWEAVLSNLFSPEDQILVLNTGNFAADWAHQAQAMGIDARLIAGDARGPVDLAALQQMLRDDTGGQIRAVLATHIDTASSLMTDLVEVRAAIDAAGHNALLVVDAVASFAAVPLQMDAWGIDVALSASQKAMMCPPGICFVAVNARALDYARGRNPAGGGYWRWADRMTGGNYQRFGGTAPQQACFALRAALDRIKAEGLDAIFARHLRLAGAVQAAMECWCAPGALRMNIADPAARAPTVTTILTPDGFAAESLRNHLRATLNVAIAGGLGNLSNKAFRIGHMGDLNEPMILGCLGAVELAMAEIGLRFDSGLTAALGALAASRR